MKYFTHLMVMCLDVLNEVRTSFQACTEVTSEHDLNGTSGKIQNNRYSGNRAVDKIHTRPGVVCKYNWKCIAL